MEIKNWLMMTLLLVAVPALIGNIWVHFAHLTGRVKNILFAWMTGFLTVMAVAQIILVPLVLRRMAFSTFVYSASGVYVLLLVISVVLFARRRKAAREAETYEHLVTAEGQTRETSWWVIFLAAAFILIFAQAIAAGFLQHIDEDDSRFIVEQNTAVEFDNMYKEHLVTGKLVYWNVGEMRKDMISPWTMLEAYWSKLSGIAPAILCHKYLPLYLILLCYAVYALIGMKLFNDDREKLSMFLIFVSALNIFGYYSTHSTQAVMLLRIWQGKALVGALMIPVMIYLMWSIMDGYRESTDTYLFENEAREPKIWYFLALVGSTASSLASGSGITLVAILIAAFGVAQLIHTKSIKHMLMMWCTAIPSVIYMLCYVNFWDLVKAYY